MTRTDSMKILIITTCCILSFGSFLIGSCMAWNDKPLWGVFIFVGFVLIGAAAATMNDLKL